MIQGCVGLDDSVKDSPALKQEAMDGIASPLPLRNTEIIPAHFFEKRAPNLSIRARSRAYRLRKTQAEYTFQLLQGGSIILSPATQSAPRKCVCIAKVTCLEHYTFNNALRVKWEFTSAGNKYVFLTRAINVFVSNIFRETPFLAFARYVGNCPVFTVDAERFSRRQKQRLIKWASREAFYQPLPIQKKLREWVKQKNYEEILHYKWGIQDSQRRNCV